MAASNGQIDHFGGAAGVMNGEDMSSKHCVAAVIVAGAMVLLAGCGGSSSPASGPGNAFVYAAGTGGSVILGFANDSKGTLRPVSGSPFSNSGQPNAMAATPNGKFLYVASSPSAVNGFSIATSGELTPLACSGVTNPPSLSQSIVIAPSGAFLYTANSGPDVTAFSIDASTGCLTFLNTASTAIPVGASRIAVDRNGHFVYGAVGFTVLAFSINPDGTLTRQPTSDFTSVALSDSFDGIAADQTADLLFLLNIHSITRVQVLTINPTNGALTETSNFFATGGNFPSGFAVDSSGAFGYVADSLGVNAFSIGPGGVMAGMPGSPFSSGSNSSSLAIDPSKRFLYEAREDSTANLRAFSINSGALTQQGTISLPSAGAYSVVVVGHP
jgi:6-phosphogluconolactonase (cycloisomerase 2 family)